MRTCALGLDANTSSRNDRSIRNQLIRSRIACGKLPDLSRQVLFSGRLLYFEHSLRSSHREPLRPGAKSSRLGYAVKNASVRAAGRFLAGTWETLMLTRIAVAFAATIGAGALMSAAAEARPELVGMHSADYSPGTILVRTGERRLYFILDADHAMRYPVGVGKSGKQWAGTTRIDGKYRNPAWSPPQEVKRDKPQLPDVIPGGLPAQSDGRRRVDAGRWRICDPWHQRAGLGRRFRLLRLHPHAERRHHRSLSACFGWHHGGGDALKSRVNFEQAKDRVSTRLLYCQKRQLLAHQPSRWPPL